MLLKFIVGLEEYVAHESDHFFKPLKLSDDDDKRNWYTLLFLKEKN